MAKKNSANSVKGVLGNTESKPPPKKQSNACKNFSFTKNDIPQIEEEAIKFYENYSARLLKIPNIIYFIFQLELGEDNKRYHLQGYIQLSIKARFTEWKDIECGAHFEPSKGSRIQNDSYCSKSDTKVLGPTIWDKSKIPLYTPEQLHMVSEDKLYDFQKQILNIIRKCNSDRYIYWFYSEKTSIGKTMIGKHLMYYDDFGLVAGDNKDIMCAIVGKDGRKPLKKGYLFNFSNDKNLRKVSYTSMEQMKDGFIFSPKYESGGMLVPPFRCVCFANGPPVVRNSDRWRIFEIRDGVLLDCNKLNEDQKIHCIKYKNVLNDIPKYRFKEKKIVEKDIIVSFE